MYLSVPPGQLQVHTHTYKHKHTRARATLSLWEVSAPGICQWLGGGISGIFGVVTLHIAGNYKRPGNLLPSSQLYAPVFDLINSDLVGETKAGLKAWRDGIAAQPEFPSALQSCSNLRCNCTKDEVGEECDAARALAERYYTKLDALVGA